MAKEQKAFELTPDMVEAANSAAPPGVSPTLSEYDHLLGFLTKLATISPVAAVQTYFSGGEADARRLIALFEQFGVLGGNRRILEFASGYGRVTRHLKRRLADNVYIASDIHPAACALINGQIGVPAMLSSAAPSGLALPGGQDFVFALSLFSHLPHSTQGAWLAELYRLLAPGGYLLITTHGEFAMRAVPDCFTRNFDPVIGFGYQSDSDQLDLSASDYGTAVVTIVFVANLVKQFAADAQIVSFRAGVWFSLQDEWIIRKPDGAVT